LGVGVERVGALVIDTLRLTVEDAVALIDAGEVSPVELHRAYLDAAAERNEELNAYLCTVEDGADGAAGVPIALKDVVSTKGVETTAGSKILAGYRPVFDATVAARCKEAGLSLLGKTNMDEFAMGSSTENSAYGPTRNPWDPARVPGGSSGGSTAAVAAGLAPWALGSDTGGSIKQPAALCGVVGLRPTYGTVSRYGIVAFASSLDQIGPIAKNVRDCARLYRIVAGRDPCDTTTVELPEPVELPDAEDLKGLRIGVPKELNEAEGIEPGVTVQVERALELARELGAEIGECRLPRSVEFGLPCYYLVAPSEASSNLARYDGVRYGLRSDANGDVRAMYDRTRHDGFGDEPKRRIMLGTYALSAGYYDAFYGQAQKVRTVIREEHAAAFEQFDVLVSPTSPTVAFELGARTADPLAMYAADLLTIPSNLAGLPGLSIPCGLSDGLPVGLQLIGRQFSENLLFRAGHALERALAFDVVPERYR
jgi:aspartyl-tRNA(Asn)/glutamyl-tRNA(Gln) amidotransferase subunit A